MDVLAIPEVQKAVAATEERMAGRGRVLRPSGTEPLVRVMVEGEDAKLVENEAQGFGAGGGNGAGLGWRT